MTLVLVRHARAGDRAAWTGDDRLRPLDERGRVQAERLPGLLADATVRRIVSSPTVRCLQTVEPLARERGLAIELADELGEERAWTDGPPLLAALLDRQAVACVHGGIERALGLDLRFRKGSVWLFERSLAEPVVLGRL